MSGWGRRDDFERGLRAAYGEPSRSFVDRLSRLVPARRGVRVGRSTLAFVVAFVALSVSALAAVGSAGSAVSFASHVLNHNPVTRVVEGVQAAFAPASRSSATAEYTGSGGQTVSVTVSSSATSQQVDPSTQTQTQTISASTSTSVDVAKGTFSTPVTVVVDPSPPAVSSGVTGSGGSAVSIVAVDKSGKLVTALDQPLEINFSLPAGSDLDSYTPAVSLNGTSYTGIAACPVGSGPESTVTGFSRSIVPVLLYFGEAIPADMTMCYWIEGSGPYAVHVWTRHLTIYGVIARTSLDVSESGRPFAPAGSGKFGDPELIHSGPARLTITGAAKPTSSGVSLSFFVDEQVASYITVFKGPQWKKVTVPITVSGSKIGTNQVEGNASSVTTLHIPILHPGTRHVTLKVPGLQAGTAYRVRVTVLDYDGNKTVAYGSFTP